MAQKPVSAPVTPLRRRVPFVSDLWHYYAGVPPRLVFFVSFKLIRHCKDSFNKLSSKFSVCEQHLLAQNLCSLFLFRSIWKKWTAWKKMTEVYTAVMSHVVFKCSGFFSLKCSLEQFSLHNFTNCICFYLFLSHYI